MTVTIFGKYRRLLSIASLDVTFVALNSAQSNAPNVRADESLLQELLNHPDAVRGTAVLPIIFCWYKGLPALYTRTDASDPTAAAQQGVNLVPRLANAINAPNGAVDDIYQLVNFNQGNFIP